MLGFEKRISLGFTLISSVSTSGLKSGSPSKRAGLVSKPWPSGGCQVLPSLLQHSRRSSVSRFRRSLG